MSVSAKNANEQTALDFFAVLSTGDLVRLWDGFFTDKTVWEPMVRDIPGAGVYKGREIIDTFLGPVRGAFKDGDPKTTVETLFSDGEIVGIESRGEGELADGRRYSNRYAWVLRVRDGKVLSIHEYMDSHYVAKLFGMS